MKNYSDTILNQKIADAAITGVAKLIGSAVYNIRTRIVVPDGIDIVSEGNCKIQCSDNPDSGISFSERKAYSSLPRGNKSGGFSINGNGIALNPLYIGYNGTRSFENIKVLNAADIGLIIEEVQNSWFSGIQVSGSKNGNLLIDKSCRTITFNNCIFSGADKFGIKITQSGLPINSGGPQCSKIYFYSNCLIERVLSEDCVLVEAGTDISFNYINTSGGGIKLRQIINQTINRVMILAGEIQTDKVWLEIKGGKPKSIEIINISPFIKGSGIISDDGSALIKSF